MVYNGETIDSIIITSNDSARIVTAEDNQGVISVISEDNIIIKDGYNVKMVPDKNIDILSSLYQKLVVLNIDTGEEIAVITHGDTPINTAADNIVVKLTPVYD